MEKEKERDSNGKVLSNHFYGCSYIASEEKNIIELKTIEAVWLPIYNSLLFFGKPMGVYFMVHPFRFLCFTSTFRLFSCSTNITIKKKGVSHIHSQVIDINSGSYKNRCTIT